MHLAYSIADQDFGSTASTGIYNISVGLLRALAGEGEAQVTALIHPGQVSLLEGLDAESVVFASPARSRLGRIRWEQGGVCRAAARLGADWLFLPKGYAPALGRCPLRLAVYVHDLIPLITAERYGEGRGVAAAGRELARLFGRGRFDVKTGPLKYAYFRACYRATLRRAGVIFTNTAFTRNELLTWAEREGIAPPPVIVAGYGFDPPSAPAGTPRRDRVLVMARDDPHRRSDLALERLRRWQEVSGYRGEVLWLGRLPGGAEAPRPANWRWSERVPAEECLRLIAGSRALVHFSEVEGFGMPPVEAVLQGVCPVFSDVPATREAMGEAGCPFRNDSFDSFAAAMQQALACPATQSKQWADTLLERHNWKKVATRVLEGMRKGGEALS